MVDTGRPQEVLIGKQVRWGTGACGMAAIAVLLSLSCGERETAGDRDPGDSPSYGGTAVVSYLAEPSSMNEFASNDGISDQLQSYVLFTTLVRYDDALRPVPYLAQSWDTAAAGEGLRLSFHLRRDVRWHDGRPTTAADVAFTLDRIKALGPSFPRASAFAAYDSAVAADSFTVDIYLRRHPGFLDPWTYTSPMPRHLLGDVPLAELQTHPFGTERPLGNGPFRFVEHRPGERWVFEAVEDFPEALGGRPHLDRLVYRVILEPVTALAELAAGSVDVYLGLAPSQVAEVEASEAASVLRFQSRRYIFINWNARRPWFADPEVRRALTMGVDRARLVEAVRYGLGEVAYSPIPPYHWAHNRDLEPLPYAPDSARAILERAGWTDADGDGVRERDGVPFSFTLITNPNPVREEILSVVQADLASIGVEVRPSVVEAQTMGATITGPERRFDAFVLGWESQFRHDDRPFFKCTQPPGPFQWSGYCNVRVERLLDRALAAPSRDRALPLLLEYQEIIHRDQPYTFLYYEVQPSGVSRDLEGVRMDIRGNFITVLEWRRAVGAEPPERVSPG